MYNTSLKDTLYTFSTNFFIQEKNKKKKKRKRKIVEHWRGWIQIAIRRVTGYICIEPTAWQCITAYRGSDSRSKSISETGGCRLIIRIVLFDHCHTFLSHSLTLSAMNRALLLSSPRRFIIRSFTSIVHYHAETLTDRVKHLPIV